MADTFTCSVCSQTFICARTDEEAKQEYEAQYGPLMGEELAVICENCVVEFDRWREENIKRLVD